MLLGRVGRLGSGARELLAVAAVIGRDFEFDLLRRAADLGERFDFTHDHVWEIVYEEISLVRRSVLHAAIGRAVVHFRAGADQASARGAYREAVRLLR
jgi:predicted ATPase